VLTVRDGRRVGPPSPRRCGAGEKPREVAAERLAADGGQPVERQRRVAAFFELSGARRPNLPSAPRRAYHLTCELDRW